MARTDLDTALKSLRGRIDGVTYKHYDYGIVATRIPRMDDVEWSPEQLLHRWRVKFSGPFYRAIQADPAIWAAYEAAGRARKRHPSALSLQVFMKLQKGESVDLPVPPGHWVVPVPIRLGNYVRQGDTWVVDKPKRRRRKSLRPRRK